MEPPAPRSELITHKVENQPNPRGARDLWHEDQPLRDNALAQGADKVNLSLAGQSYGCASLQQAAHDARRDVPRLSMFDRTGRRLDEVLFHPGYHQIMSTATSLGYVQSAWQEGGSHVTHAAHVYMLSQLEPGLCCPLTMSYAAVPVLRAHPDIGTQWMPKLLSAKYDPTIRSVGAKTGATLGMAMTEKQGGSDVRANTTHAVQEGDHYRLTGHKWFCSAPMSDGFLTLAQAKSGLTCFLVPRWLDAGRNSINIQRLKDKMGNRANASAEIEYHDALAYRLGEEGAGVRTIIEMVHHTRLDTAMAPAGLMRAALNEAHWWVSHRTAFQRKLIDQPLMRTVLADMALDVEGALSLAMMVAGAFDSTDESARAFARVGVALAKFINNKRCVPLIAEAMEVLGGMGYVEDTPMPMLYREAPLNGIWEGSGNVICLDILRSLAREPLAAHALNAVLDDACSGNPRFAQAVGVHRAQWPAVATEAEARWFAESLANLLTAAALIKGAPSAISEGYIYSRLGQARGGVYGAIGGLDSDAILARLGDVG